MRARAGLILGLLGICAAQAVVVAPPAAAATLPAVWVRELPGSAIREASPALVDLTGSGQLDVVVGAHSGHLWGLRGTNGGDAPGWPLWLGQPIDSSAAVADLDFDSRSDLVVGSGNGGPGALWSLTRDGGVRFRRELGDNTFGAPSVFATPAIGDLTGDGRPDLAAASLGVESAWMLNADGNNFFTYPHFWDDTIHASPALADVDRDGILDMVVAGDATAGGRVDHHGGIVRALNIWGHVLWEFRTDEIVRSSPSIGDLDRDGRPEVVFGGGDYYGGTDSTAVFALDLSTGGLKWRRGLNGVPLSSPALSDIDGDGDLEVAVGTFPSNHGRGGGQFAYVLDGASGGDFGNFPQWVQSGSLGAVTTADADGDGWQDLFVPTGAWLAVVSGRTGERLYNLGENMSISFSSAAAIADVDRDGQLDVVTAGTRHDGTGVVIRWQLPPQARLGTYAWPQFRRDERRTGSWLAPRAGDVVGMARRPGGAGYWTVTAEGAVTAGNGAPALATLAGQPLNQPVVGIAPTPSGNGYWLVARDGGVFSFGDAAFHGSTGGIRLNQAVVGIAGTASGNGYWLVAADGGIFAFGDAAFHGSQGATRLNRPVVGMAATPSGNGYWMVASDGGIFTQGDAPFFGSTGDVVLSRPITGMTVTPSGGGYEFVATDGGVFTFGDAPFHGSLGGSPTPSPVMGMALTNSANGYWMVNAVGQVLAFGAATP